MWLFGIILFFNICPHFLSYNHILPVSAQSHENSRSTNTTEDDHHKENNNKVDSSFNYDGRIVGGLATSIFNFPYQVSVQYKRQHTCGGAIIRPHVIITAAHCVEKSMQATAFQVRAGSTRHSSGGQLRNVQSILRHEGYTSATYNYDIALLQLEQSLTYTRTVQAIQLAATNEKLSAQTPLLISGWGLNSESGYLTTLLNYVAVTVIPQEICVKNYKYIVPVTTEMFCAGHSNGGKDACQGDSGGPLVANRRGIATLYGIVSWGVGCAQKRYPGVYANVSALRSWVDGKLAQIEVKKN